MSDGAWRKNMKGDGVWRFTPAGGHSGRLFWGGLEVGTVWEEDARDIVAGMNAVPLLLDACRLAADALSKAGATAEGTRGAAALEAIDRAAAAADPDHQQGA